MINKSNIKDYVIWVHYKKYQAAIEVDKAAKWQALSNEEIQVQLNHLYTRWGIDIAMGNLPILILLLIQILLIIVTMPLIINPKAMVNIF
jgi:hypothetical protein